MKKKLLIAACLLYAAAAHSQSNQPANHDLTIDWKEDSTEIITINDIIKVQRGVTELNSRGSHFTEVWGRRGFFNVAYSSTKLSPKNDILSGFDEINDGKVPEFKSNWGLTLQYGRSYRLHKKPIANVVQVNLDFTGIDFSVNHFKAETPADDSEYLFDSSMRWKFDGAERKDNIGPPAASENGDDYYTGSFNYLPWNLEKYEASFGMSLGPSITIAPFTYMDSKQLHFLKLNLYYHLGYNLSGMAMIKDEDLDRGGKDSKYHEQVAKSTQLVWGHGMSSSIGFSLSWKFIGIGYEHRGASIKYKPTSTNDFGDVKHKFSSSSNRIYIQFHM